jgi:hypothetical protein
LGETITWHTDVEPAVIDPAELCAACEALAAEVKSRLGDVPRQEHNGHTQERAAGNDRILERARR